MSEFLLYYQRPDPTTWAYLSSFLTIGLYFVFHRFWSIRNLDIVLLILLAPGLLMVHEGYRRQLRDSEAVARQKQESERLRTSQPVSARTASSWAPALPPMFLVAQLTPPEQVTPPEQETPPVLIVDDPEASEAETEANLGQPDRESMEADTDQGVVGLDPASASESDLGSSAGQPQTQFSATDLRRWGFMYLFVIEAMILLRLLLDPMWVRRPLLDPNLTAGGLNFIGISLFIFMMANVVTSSPRIQVEQGPALGPGYAMMNMLPAIPTRPVSDQPGGVSPLVLQELSGPQQRLATIAKVLAIAAHLAILSGMVLISNRHFSNIRAGFGCATLYLMLPYTAQMTGRVDHAVPAALLLWAILNYRKPLIAGIFLGLAGGLVYYPLFLLPLWFSFYWQRGARPFAIGVIAMLVLLMIALTFDNSATLTEHLRRMFGILNPNRQAHELRGLWALGWNPIWRLPVIVAFVILSVFFAIWPAQKNLGTLLSGSAALMVAAQFWHGSGGGLYIAWFLPLLLLTIFRPNLQDRVATKVVIGGEPYRQPRSELETV